MIVHKVHIHLYSLPMAHVKTYPKSCWVRARSTPTGVIE